MAGDESTQPGSNSPLERQAQGILQQVPLAATQTIILASGPQVVAHRGELKLTEAQELAVSVAEGWQERGQSARVQFMRLPMLKDERLLYTRRLAGDLLLTVADQPEAALTSLIRLAGQLAPLLETLGAGPP